MKSGRLEPRVGGLSGIRGAEGSRTELRRHAAREGSPPVALTLLRYTPSWRGNAQQQQGTRDGRNPTWCDATGVEDKGLGKVGK